MQQTDTTLNSAPELYDIQMLESLDISIGKELICTELDLESEEIDSMNACARVLGLIPEDDYLTDIQIRAINVEEKRVLGFVAHSSNSLSPQREITLYIREGCNKDLEGLKDFIIRRKYHDGRDQTNCLYKGVVDNPIESAYLLLLHNILLTHGILRDNPEFLAQMQAREKELSEIQNRENDDAEQQQLQKQLEMDLESFENYVNNKGNIHIKDGDTDITVEKNGDIFIIKCLKAGAVMFEYQHEKVVNREGVEAQNSYTIKCKGRIFWDPKSMIKIARYSKEIFGDTLEIIKQRITQ